MGTHHFFPFKNIPTYFRNFKKDVRPDGIRSVHFLKSEWESFQPETRVSAGYLVYRVMFMVAFSIILITQVACWSTIPSQGKFYLVYLTNWTNILSNLYAVLFLVRVIQARCQYRNTVIDSSASEITDNSVLQPRLFLKPNSLKPLEKGIWICLETSFVLSYIVTAGYWVFLYEGKKHKHECAKHTPYMVHGINSLLMTLDMFVVAVPIRLFHFLYSGLIGVVYIAFTGIYEVAGGQYPVEDSGKMNPYIYGFLNWREKPKYAIIVPFLGFAILVGLQLFTMFLYSLRLCFVSIANPKRNIYREHFYDYGKEEPVNPENNNTNQPEPGTDAVTPEAGSENP